MSSPLLGLAWNHYQAGNFAEAERLCRQELHLQPGNANLWCFLGVILRGAGLLDDAALCQREALRLQPGLVEAQVNLANVLMLQDKFDEAIAYYQEVLRQRPDMAQVHNNLAVTLSKKGRLEEAVASYRQAIHIAPNYSEAYNNLGDALCKLRRWGEAEESCRRALSLQPSSQIYLNLGVIQWSAGKFAEALVSCTQAIQLNPANPGGYLNRSRVHMALGNLNEAERDIDESINRKPGDREMRVARAVFWLMRGDYQRGWLEYEFREKDEGFTKVVKTATLWDGRSFPGRTIFLKAEQGFGDTFQFARYAPLVKEKGGQVILACRNPLVSLLSTCPGFDHIVSDNDP